MNRHVIMHIGLSKTGSSALQSVLSTCNEHQFSDHRRAEYCVIQNNGDIVRGQKLRALAAASELNYASSAINIAQSGGLKPLKKEIVPLFDAGIVPIFSQEDWYRSGEQFLKADFFKELDCTATVIAYVRPQAEWFNSGWWQWWAWMDEFKKPQDVIDRWGYHFLRWSSLLETWKSIPGVTELKVRSHPQDIAKDFFSCLNLAPDWEKIAQVPQSHNVSLSPTIIKILKLQPGLRKAHDATVDFLLSSILDFKEKTPWALPLELTQDIIEHTREDNEKMLALLAPENRTAMLNDSRWWNDAAYREKKTWEEKDFVLTEEESKSIIIQLVKNLICDEANPDQAKALQKT